MGVDFRKLGDIEHDGDKKFSIWDFQLQPQANLVGVKIIACAMGVDFGY